MKFQHLPLGARFAFEGQTYTKTGPLTAVSAQGGQRIIPRFAVLEPLDAGSAPPRAGRCWEESQVRTALETLHGECARLLQTVSEHPEKLAAARALLDAARQRFLDSLE